MELDKAGKTLLRAGPIVAFPDKKKPNKERMNASEWGGGSPACIVAGAARHPGKTKPTKEKSPNRTAGGASPRSMINQAPSTRGKGRGRELNRATPEVLANRPLLGNGSRSRELGQARLLPAVQRVSRPPPYFRGRKFCSACNAARAESLRQDDRLIPWREDQQVWLGDDSGSSPSKVSWPGRRRPAGRWQF
jgi:hypothetical protein